MEALSSSQNEQSQEYFLKGTFGETQLSRAKVIAQNTDIIDLEENGILRTLDPIYHALFLNNAFF